MDVISRVLAALVAELIRTERLVLAEGGDAALLVAEVKVHVRTAGGFSQAGGVISSAILRSPHVDDLFASDREIVVLLGQVDY